MEGETVGIVVGTVEGEVVGYLEPTTDQLMGQPSASYWVEMKAP